MARNEIEDPYSRKNYPKTMDLDSLDDSHSSGAAHALDRPARATLTDRVLAFLEKRDKRPKGPA
jgi:hypothetical protein